jgi:hypothetical protein
MAFAVHPLQLPPDMNSSARRNSLDVSDFAEEFELGIHSPTLRVGLASITGQIQV